MRTGGHVVILRKGWEQVAQHCEAAEERRLLLLDWRWIVKNLKHVMATLFFGFSLSPRHNGEKASALFEATLNKLGRRLSDLVEGVNEALCCDAGDISCSSGRKMGVTAQSDLSVGLNIGDD